VSRPALTLASGSAIRRKMLEDAGVPHAVDRPRVDEAAIKRDASALEDAALAVRLAEAKAVEVSGRVEGLCLGADQLLAFDGQRLDKADTMEAARARLAAMRGRPHALVCGTALARDGAVVWRHAQTSRIWMRDYSDAFLDAYLAEAGEPILASVACYQFEGLGAQLFARVEGDYHAILGLPLLPVLEALRAEGALPE